MRASLLLALLAFAAALAAASFLALADTYHGETCSVAPGGAPTCVSDSRTLIEENGAWVLALLAVPLLATGAAAASVWLNAPRLVEWALAWLLLLACFVSIFSIGLFFLPAALLLLAAAAFDRRELVKTTRGGGQRMSSG